MAKPGLIWKVDDRQWKAGVAALPVACGAAAEARLKEVVDEGFSRSQQTVHVVSGALRDSGRVERVDTGYGVTFIVTYGGTGEVEYAGYEELLHPFLEPAMVEALAEFETDMDVLDSVRIGF